jgi:type II secretory pathway component PulF
MAKVDDPRLPGWDDPPLPLNSSGKGGKRSHFRQLSLIHIMIFVIYCAILLWSVKQIIDTDGAVAKIMTGVLVGVGFCAVGLWGVIKLASFAVIGWILFVIGYMAITIATTSALALPTLPILIGAIIFLSLRRHANNQDALLWVLEVAADQGIPLGPGVQAFSSQVTGMYQIWTGALADLLRRGVPLPEALENIPRLVPRRSAFLIRMGWESGNLALGLKEAGATRETRQPVLHAIGGRMAYLGWVASIGFFIVGFIMYFIIPKFEAIFKDFGVSLPELTILVIRTSHVVVDYAWLATLAFLAALIYGVVGLLGPGDLSIPLFDQFFARRHMITILRSLSVVVSADRPIPQALYSLSQWYPTGWVRKRLVQASLDVSQGVDWTAALRETGLLSSSDVGVLASAQRAGNLAWALRELAETGERRWAYRLQAWSQLLFALTILMLGFLVFIITVAFFMPLITLIERLAS